MRIKFTCAHANQGEVDGHLGEETIFTPDYPDAEKHTARLAELHRSIFEDLVSEALMNNGGELHHATEQDLATGVIVWRVYVRGLVCCMMHAQQIVSILAGCTKRFFEYASEGVAKPPTNAAHYRTEPDDEDEEEQERILN